MSKDMLDVIMDRFDRIESMLNAHKEATANCKTDCKSETSSIKTQVNALWSIFGLGLLGALVNYFVNKI